MDMLLDVRAFGAKGDGISDDTDPVQQAIDEGARSGRAVYISPGRYSVGELVLHPGSTLRAQPQWGFHYHTIGAAVLIQRFDDQRCVLNLSHANGAELDGLSLTGENRQGGCCGILCDKAAFGPIEDAFRIERCRVAAFSGHAVYLNRIWCFTLRHNMFCFSKGDGLRVHGWDAFVSDNWFSGNEGAGYQSEGDNCSVTMTGNRVEWNKGGGIIIEGGSHYNLTGNYIDRSGKAGIAVLPATVLDDDSGRIESRVSNTITITGNIVYRSGKFAQADEESCHLILKGCAGVTVTGNSFCIGRDDKGKGAYSPKSGMILDELTECAVTGNTLFLGALEMLVDDRGGHRDTVIRDNVGSLFPKEAVLSTRAALPTNLILDYRKELKHRFFEADGID